MARISRISITVAPEAYVCAALMVILIPLPWLSAWLIAVVIHELFHCLAIILSGKQISGIEIRIDGARIQTGALSDIETLFCTLAGPIGGLSLLLGAHTFPKLAVCAFLQSVYNLLPIYPLDGGRAFLSMGRILFSEVVAHKLYLSVKALLLSVLLFFGLLAAFAWKLGLLPLAFAVLLILRTKKIKIPCK